MFKTLFLSINSGSILDSVFKDCNFILAKQSSFKLDILINIKFILFLKILKYQI